MVRYNGGQVSNRLLLIKYSPNSSWVQAEKRSYRWRDWEGQRLRDLMWYEDLDDEGADEPSRGDKFGYIRHGSVWGASKQAEHPFVCAYQVDQFCNRL